MPFVRCSKGGCCWCCSLFFGRVPLGLRNVKPLNHRPQGSGRCPLAPHLATALQTYLRRLRTLHHTPHRIPLQPPKASTAAPPRFHFGRALCRPLAGHLPALRVPSPQAASAVGGQQGGKPSPQAASAARGLRSSGAGLPFRPSGASVPAVRGVVYKCNCQM